MNSPPPTVHHTGLWQKHRRKVRALAQRIISGEVGVIEGSRQMASFEVWLHARSDEDFRVFAGVNSESDHLPVGEVRKYWSPDALPQTFMRTAALAIFLSFVAAIHAAGVTARALQRELHLDDSKWRLLSETPTSVSWASDSGLAVTLNVIPELNAQFPPPSDLPRLRSVYREEALSYGGGLVEAEPKSLSGVYYNWVMMKFPIGLFQSPPDNRPGFGYQLNAVFPTTEGRYVLQVAAAETGTTGVREAAGVIIFMKQEGISDLAAAAKAFRRDPYERSHDARALFNVCDEARFDSSFPDHPLSRCRSEMDRLLKSLVITDRIRRIAQFGAEEGPNPERLDGA